MNIKLRNSVVALGIMGAIFVGTSGETIKGCSAGSGGSGSHQPHRPAYQPRPDNEEHVGLWCRSFDRNNPDTYVYLWEDTKTGKRGFIRGRDNAKIHKLLHPSHRVKEYCR